MIGEAISHCKIIEKVGEEVASALTAHQSYSVGMRRRTSVKRFSASACCII